MLGALLAGAIAGLAVAMPLGPIGMLLVERSSRLGFRPSVPAALGVATTDGLYAALAALAGAAISAALSGSEDELRIVSGSVLMGVAAYGLITTLRRRVEPASEGSAGAHHRTFVTFLALTAINPATIATFAALIAGLPEIADAEAAAKAAFVAGAFAASAAWQVSLVGAGAVAGARLPAHARAFTALFGYGLVAALAVRMLVA